MKILPAILFLALSSPPALAADSCTPVRIDQPANAAKGIPEGSMAAIPVMDQDSTGTCFCYSAVQMVDAYRFQNPSANRAHITSPLAACLDNAKTLGYDSLDEKGGHIRNVFELVYKHGSCSYKKVGDKLGTYDIEGFMKGLEIRFDKYKDSGGSRASVASMACYLHDRQLLPSNFKVEALLEKLQEDNFIRFAYSTIKGVCSEKGNAVKLKGAPVLDVVSGTRHPEKNARHKKFKQMIDTVKSPTSLPVGVYLCQEFMFDKGYRGVEADGLASEDCVPHTSLVVGRRRTMRGTCEILLRNSWGASCSGYDWTCDGRGQIWVDEKELLTNTLGTVQLP